jgi:hypothetical protein
VSREDQGLGVENHDLPPRWHGRTLLTLAVALLAVFFAAVKLVLN